MPRSRRSTPSSSARARDGRRACARRRPKRETTIPPEREELLANVTRARAEDRMQRGLDICRRCSTGPGGRGGAELVPEIESVRSDREVERSSASPSPTRRTGTLNSRPRSRRRSSASRPGARATCSSRSTWTRWAARKRADDLVARARDYAGAGRIGEAQVAGARGARCSCPGTRPRRSLGRSWPRRQRCSRRRLRRRPRASPPSPRRRPRSLPTGP